MSATQLDVLMAEMRDDPIRAMFVAPRLDHSMKQVGRPRREKEKDRDKDKIERDKGSGGLKIKGRSSHKSKAATLEDGGEAKSNMSKFKRSISWTLMPRPTDAKKPNQVERAGKGAEESPPLPPKRKSADKAAKKRKKEKPKEKHGDKDEDKSP